MTIPTVAKVHNFNTDLDAAADCVNTTSETFETRLSGTKLSLQGVLNQCAQGNITTYSSAATYSNVTDWVEDTGIVYRPIPSFLPIGPEVFDSSKWVIATRPQIYQAEDQADLRTKLAALTYKVGDVVYLKSVGMSGQITAGTTDNTGTIISDGASGFQWEMDYTGAIDASAFLDVSSPDNFNNFVALMAEEVATGKTVIFPEGEFLTSAGLPSIAVRANNWIGQGFLKTKITYTGSGAENLLRVLSATGNRFTGIWFSYSDALYTDRLITTYNSARVAFNDCKFGSDTLSNCDELIDLDLTSQASIRDCWFIGANKLINGWDTVTSTAVNISGCWFDRYNTCAIKNVGQGWTISNDCAFEYGLDNGGRAIVNDAGKPAYGLKFTGNWCGDASLAAGYTWIVINGFGINIEGNYINGDGFGNAVAVAVNDTTSGLVVKGNFLSSLATGVDLGVNKCTYSDVETNSYSSVVNKTIGTWAYGDNNIINRELTFIPELRINGSTAGITYTRQSGKIKIDGNQAFYHVDIALSSKGAATGPVDISGISYVANGDIGQAGNIGYFSNLASAYTPNARLQESGSLIVLGKFGSVTWVQLTDADLTNTTNLTISGNFFF